MSQVTQFLGLCFQESDYFTPQGEFRVDSAGSKTLLNCLMYKLSYYRFGELQVCHNSKTFILPHLFCNVVSDWTNFGICHKSKMFTLPHLLCNVVSDWTNFRICHNSKMFTLPHLLCNVVSDWTKFMSIKYHIYSSKYESYKTVNYFTLLKFNGMQWKH